MPLSYTFPGIEMANEILLQQGGYYVYAWACADWGDIYFYVGKGTGGRYKSTKNRGRAFMATFNNWTVYPVILYSGLTVEQAEKLEDEIKTDFIFNRGFPVVDGEGNSASLKNRAIRLAKREKRENDPNWREGRKQIEIPDFEKFLKKQKDGEMTVEECCKELNISRRTWYNRVSSL